MDQNSLEHYVSNTTSVWTGADGESSLTLTTQDGIIKGRYTTQKGRIDSDDMSVDVVGYQNGPLLSFSASWGKAHSVTSWVGRLAWNAEKDCPELHLMWHLAREYSDLDTKRRNELWESFLTYSNTMIYTESQDNKAVSDE